MAKTCTKCHKTGADREFQRKGTRAMDGSYDNRYYTGVCLDCAGTRRPPDMLQRQLHRRRLEREAIRINKERREQEKRARRRARANKVRSHKGKLKHLSTRELEQMIGEE